MSELERYFRAVRKPPPDQEELRWFDRTEQEGEATPEPQDFDVEEGEWD